MSLRPSLFLLALAACNLRPYDLGATDGATSTTTTLDPGASWATSDAATTTSTATTAPHTTGTSTSQSFIVTRDLAEGECDPFADACPEGQKCSPYSSDGDNSWDSNKCVPIARDPAALGEPCTMGTVASGEDTCDDRLMCWGVDSDTGLGKCIARCGGVPDKPTCDPPCTACLIDGAGVLNICLPTCTPLFSGCPDFHPCLPDALDPPCFACLDPGAGGQVFTPCEAPNDCADRLHCGPPAGAIECDPQAAGCCLPFCDLDDPDCPGESQECVAWFAPGDAPSGLEDLGSCTLPG